MASVAVREQLGMQIRGAISMGAPAYNSGDIAGCAKIYTATANSMLRDPSLPAGCRSALETGLAKAAGGDANAQAWALRNALDSTLALLGAGDGAPAPSSPSRAEPPVVLAYPVDGASAPQLPLRAAIQQAIAAGVPLWNSGDYGQCAMVYKAVAVQYKDMEPRLAAALRSCEAAPLDASSGSQGWIIRRAFDSILEGGRASRSYGGASNGREYMERQKESRTSATAVRLGQRNGPLEWYVLNDTVMGGQSSSTICATAGGGLLFSGLINLNGGGFASCRTLINSGNQTHLGLASPARAIRLSVTGDGQMYKVGLRASDGFREPTWQAQFLTRKGERITVTLPLDEETWHGSIMGRRAALPRGEPIPWGSMQGVGFSLSLLDVMGAPSDPASFHAGPFELQLHSMEVLSAV